MRRIAVMAAAAALLFAGCGGDDEPAAESTPESTPAEQSTPAGGGGSTLAIEADPGGENAFTETEFTAQAGEVTIEFSNPADKPHAVEVEGNGVEEETETVTASDAPPLTVNLEPGEYTIYCPVGNHRADGMEGTLTVE